MKEFPGLSNAAYQVIHAFQTIYDTPIITVIELTGNNSTLQITVSDTTYFKFVLEGTEYVPTG